MNSDQDYSTAGFDKLLSRGDIQNLQGSLDQEETINNAIPFDRTQLTGSQGDAYNMGGISMTAKDSAITLNDGQLIVNDTSTNSSINASSGNITYFDSSGNLVVQEGLLPDGATGIRIVDKQQIGLAQFGRFKDGTTALKIAKANVEVATARDDQLIFNSNQDVFKIISKQTISLTIVHNGTSSTGTTNLNHGFNGIPAFVAYITPDPFFSNISVVNTNNGPNPFPIIIMATGVATIAANFIVSADTTIISFGGVISNKVGAGTYVNTATVYLLQETAT